MGHPDDVRVVLREQLLAGVTFHAGILAALLAEQRHGKCSRHSLLADSPLSRQNISVGNSPVPDCLLEMVSDQLMSENVLKSCHRVSFQNAAV